MIHLGKTTEDSPAQVIEKASRFFGPDGVGLKVALREDEAIYLVGTGGHVQVTACKAEDVTDGKETSVDIQSREWEKQAQDFLAEI